MFNFRRFSIDDSRCDMKVGTDGVLLGAWADVEYAATALDAGTGSGLISLMISQRNPRAVIDAVECSLGACQDAIKNTGASPMGQNIKVMNDDITTMTLSDHAYDLIISNPPFFTESLKSPDSGRAGSRHEDTFGVGWLLENAARLLTSRGTIAFIAPSSRDNEIEFIIELHRLHTLRKCSVIPVAGKPAKRTMWQLSPVLTDTTEYSTLTIRNNDHSLTPEYKELTSDFYL